jgi:hypothetical protein
MIDGAAASSPLSGVPLWHSAAPALECHFFPGLPGLPGWSLEIVPKTVPGGVPGLWELITPDCKIWSWRDLNQTCSPRRDLSNDISHSQLEGREEVDSWLLVIGSQIVNLTPGPSFAHNLSYRCSNDQCEAIFYIYASRPFQWHQEHLNARCFGPCCWALNIRESRRTPNPHFFQVLGFTFTLGQSRVATKMGAHLGVCGFIPLQRFTFLKTRNVIPRLHFRPTPLLWSRA